MTRATAAQAPRNVLIVLMGSLGDVVRGLALVDACKAAWSECSITWLVEPACAGIVRLHPRIDRVVVFERSRGLAGVLNLRRELRREHFDVTLDLQRHLKSGLIQRIRRSATGSLIPNLLLRAPKVSRRSSTT